MKLMKTIIIDVGVYTAIDIDLTEFDFTGIEKLILTAKNSTDTESPVVFQREYTEPIIINEIITPKESLLLRRGAVYDFISVLVDGKGYKESSNGSISLREGVGRVEQD